MVHSISLYPDPATWLLTPHFLVLSHVTPTGLELVEATIDGSGAGMDPPAGAVLRDGRWHYRPRLPPQRKLTLTRSGYTDDYRICQRQRCQSFTQLLGPPIATGERVDLFPCELRSR